MKTIEEKEDWCRRCEKYNVHHMGECPFINKDEIIKQINLIDNAIANSEFSSASFDLAEAQRESLRLKNFLTLIKTK